VANTFALGKKAIALCDRCGQRYPLKKLKNQPYKQRPTNLLVCPECLDVDHPQLMLGSFPVYDPQALRNPRPDINLAESRDIQWGWNPVGGGNNSVDGGTPNTLVGAGEVGTVTVTTS